MTLCWSLGGHVGSSLVLGSMITFLLCSFDDIKLKGILKQKYRWFSNGRASFTDSKSERTMSQLLFLHDIFLNNLFSWEPPLHKIASHFITFLRLIAHFCVSLAHFCIWFSLSKSETQKCANETQKCAMRRKNVLKWDRILCRGGSQEYQLFKDISWRKRSWDMVLSLLELEN